MFRLGLVACVMLSMAALSLAGSDDEAVKKVKSDAARNALTEYDKSVAMARKLYEKEAEAARRKLLVELDFAQAKAARANQLTEAVLIRDIRSGFGDPKLASPPDSRLQIIAAFYGQNISWIDVTEKVRQAANGKARFSATVNTNDLGEPAPGWDGRRTLTVRYSFAGNLGFKAVYEGKLITLP